MGQVGEGPAIPPTSQQLGNPIFQAGLVPPCPIQTRPLHGKTSPLPVSPCPGSHEAQENGPQAAGHITIFDTSSAAESPGVSSEETKQVFLKRELSFFTGRGAVCW